MSESTTAGPRPGEPGAATQDPTIRPFQVSVPEEDLVELRRRIEATRWPERETVDNDSQGVPLATEIDGLDIHFLHVRSRHADALPLIVTHGWPGSIIEQLKIIGPLTDPTSHGGSEADAFHVVIPRCRVTGSRPSRTPPAGTRCGSRAPGSSWAVVATADKAAGTDVVRSMAQRAGAEIAEVDASHVVMVSQPQVVTDLVLKAVNALSWAALTRPRLGTAQETAMSTNTPGTSTSFGPLKQVDAGVLDVGYAEPGPADGPAVLLAAAARRGFCRAEPSGTTSSRRSRSTRATTSNGGRHE